MSDKVDIKLEGMDELVKKVEEMGKKGARAENKALKKAGNMMALEMTKEAPVRTGNLMGSMEVSNIKTKSGIKRVEVGPAAYYSHFVEFGTSKMKAQPFMAPTYESKKKEAQDIIRRELKKELGLE